MPKQITLNIGLNRKVRNFSGRKFIIQHKNATKVRFSGYNWQDPKLHEAVRNYVTVNHPGWQLTGYAPSFKHVGRRALKILSAPPQPDVKFRVPKNHPVNDREDYAKYGPVVSAIAKTFLQENPPKLAGLESQLAFELIRKSSSNPAMGRLYLQVARGLPDTVRQMSPLEQVDLVVAVCAMLFRVSTSSSTYANQFIVRKSLVSIMTAKLAAK